MPWEKSGKNRTATTEMKQYVFINQLKKFLKKLKILNVFDRYVKRIVFETEWEPKKVVDLVRLISILYRQMTPNIELK